MMRFPEHSEAPQNPEKQWLAALERIGAKVESLVSLMYPELDLELSYIKYAPNPGITGAEYIRKIGVGLAPKDKSRLGFALIITDPTDDYIDNRLEDAIRKAHEHWKNSGG